MFSYQFLEKTALTATGYWSASSERIWNGVCTAEKYNNVSNLLPNSKDEELSKQKNNIWDCESNITL